MPKFTLDNSFRFYSQNETTTNFHSESIERLLQKLSSADWLPLYARDGLIQAYLMGWKKMIVKINDVLDDAMKKQATNLSVNMWLAKLQILACDVEDLLDEFQTETFRRELMPGESTTQPSTSQRLNPMAMSRVKEVTARLQNISWQIALLGLKSRNVRRRLVPTSLVSVKDKLVHGLVSWVDSVAREEWTAELFDVDLLWYPNIEEEIVEMLQIGMDCVQRVPEQRPKMVDVVKMIEEIMYPS